MLRIAVARARRKARERERVRARSQERISRSQWRRRVSGINFLLPGFTGTEVLACCLQPLSCTRPFHGRPVHLVARSFKVPTEARERNEQDYCGIRKMHAVAEYLRTTPRVQRRDLQYAHCSGTVFRHGEAQRRHFVSCDKKSAQRRHPIDSGICPESGDAVLDRAPGLCVRCVVPKEIHQVWIFLRVTPRPLPVGIIKFLALLPLALVQEIGQVGVLTKPEIS